VNTIVAVGRGAFHTDCFIGFKDDPRKEDEEELRLEVEVRPGWAPGRRMWLPKASAPEVVVPEGRPGKG